jgi:hypothetical protein
MLLRRCLVASSRSRLPPRLLLQLPTTRGLAAVPLSLVKELRNASGAPITDCKKALEVRL